MPSRTASRSRSASSRTTAATTSSLPSAPGSPTTAASRIPGPRFDPVLDLGGVDVEPAGDHQLLDPVDDGHEAVVVDDHDVAGAQPAVLEQHRGGLLGPVPVAGEHLRSADQ